MTTENTLAETSSLPLTIPQGGVNKYSNKDAQSVTSTGFLPRLQACDSNSSVVKKKLIAVGVLGLVYSTERVEDMGLETDVLLICWRPKAIRFTKDGSVFSYFDRDTKEFKQVAQESGIKDSGCQFGVELLSWIPSKQLFATIFLGSATGRREAPGFLQLMEKEKDVYVPAPATVVCKFIEPKGSKFSWYALGANPCTTPLSVMPTQEQFDEEVEKFNNPVSSAVEAAPVAETRAR